MKPFLWGCVAGALGLLGLIAGLVMWDDRRSYKRVQRERGRA